LKIPGKKFAFNIIDKAKSKIAGNGLILLYHKISDEKLPDIFNLSVSPENFESHLGIINELGDVISLYEFVSRHRNNTLTPKNISLTFDDGYADNYHNALPLLVKNNTSAAIFIASKYIDGFFWWEKLFQSILKTEKKKISFSLGSMNLDSLNGRIKEFKNLHIKIKDMPFDRQNIIVDEIFHESHLSENDIKNRAINLKELQNISQNNLIDIGGHTETHSRLSLLSSEEQETEIKNNKLFLENNLDKKVKYFAYPYGLRNDYNNETIRLLRKENFTAAFVNRNSAVTRYDDNYTLPRLWVNNLSKEKFRSFLKSWIN
jgi:peptidoglycan/xylan/chitin deacetylase (PgdA/CDA1 family)